MQLGNGQLALFNLLKAYSLMDQDVGYCQGLSFVAGILLMHVSTLIMSPLMGVGGHTVFGKDPISISVSVAFCLHFFIGKTLL